MLRRMVGLVAVAVLVAGCTVSPELAKKPVRDFQDLTVGEAVATMQALQQLPIPESTKVPTPTPIPQPTATSEPTPTFAIPTPTPTIDLGPVVDPRTCYTVETTRGFVGGGVPQLEFRIKRLPSTPNVETTCGSQARLTIAVANTGKECTSVLTPRLIAPSYTVLAGAGVGQCDVGVNLYDLWLKRQAELDLAYSKAFSAALEEAEGSGVFVAPDRTPYILKDMPEIRNAFKVSWTIFKVG